METELRPLTARDAPAWAALYAATEKVDDTGESYTAEELAEELVDPARDPERDFVGAWARDRLVGFASVMARDTLEPGDPPTHRIELEGATHPDLRGRGLGGALLTWATRRAREAHRERFVDAPALLQCYGALGNTEQADLLSGAGFVARRWMFGMERDLAHPVTPSAVPDGLVLRPYASSPPGTVRQAHNAAFADHWGFTPWSAAMWEQWVTSTRAFRPAISLVLVEQERPEEVAGYLVGYEYDAVSDGAREAYVGKIGVLRRWRGRGAASALLACALRACRDAGYERVALDVDADNPTGALALYRRAGFEVRRRSAVYVRPLD